MNLLKQKKKKKNPNHAEWKTTCNVWWSRKPWVLLVHFMVTWIISSFWLHTTSREYHLGAGFWRKKMCISCLALPCKASFMLWTSFSVAFYHSLSLPSLTLSPLSCFSHFFSSHTLSASPHTPLSLPFVLSFFLYAVWVAIIPSSHFSISRLWIYQIRNLFVCSHSILKLTFKRNKNDILIFND